MLFTDEGSSLTANSVHALADPLSEPREVLYLEPELAVVPEALWAPHKGMAVLGSSNSDMGVGALVSKGAHASLAAIAVWQG